MAKKFVDDSKILELYKTGMLHREIAKALGYGVSTVTHHLLDMGYGMEVVDKICADTAVEDDNGTVAKNNQPVIEKITIID